MTTTLAIPAAVALLSFLAAMPAPAGLHDPFDELLAKHVADGVVDYAGFQKDEAELDAYLGSLGKTEVDKLDENGRKAFWINAYNAFTIKLILNHYPGLESIRDIPRGDRWKWEGWMVGGDKTSLDAIEHEFLRPMGDPRIHFAINCASWSCPDLIPEAYRPETLDDQLEDVTRAFFASETKGLRVGMDKGLFGGEKPAIFTSQILHWFADDFESDGSDRVDFVLQYAPNDARAFIEEHRDDLAVEKLDYDWSLNGK